MSNQSIIEHKANMYYVEFREDYLNLCLGCTYKKSVRGKEKSKASAYCKSFILAISESWTNEKRSLSSEISFYMTDPQWCESMYGMFGRNVVIDSVDELIGEGLLSREPIKYKGKDTFRYTLNYKEINRRMKDLPERTPYNTLPQVNALISKRDEKSTGLQVNGKAFTNQPDTRLQVNDDPFTKGRNIESTNHPYTEPAQNTEGTYSERESENAQIDATASTPAPDTHSQVSPDEDRVPYAPDFNASRQPHIANDTPEVPHDNQSHGTEDRPAPSHPASRMDSGNHGEHSDHGSEASSPQAGDAPDRRNAQGPARDTQTVVDPVPVQATLTALVEKPASAHVEPAKPKRTRTKPAAPPPPEFTAEGRKVYDAWCANFKSPPRAAEKTVDCADALYPRLVPWCQELKLSCKDLLNEIQKHLYKTDTSGFYKRGVTLCDIDRDFEKWQSAKTQELAELALNAAPKQKEPSTIELLRAQKQRYAPREGGVHA